MVPTGGLSSAENHIVFSYLALFFFGGAGPASPDPTPNELVTLSSSFMIVHASSLM